MSGHITDKYKRVFIASSELFSGFEVEMDIRNIDTLDDIVNIFIDNLKKVLKEYNFEILHDSVNAKKFHIHSHTLEDILVSNKDEIFYVCDHCSS
jgi:hypothetical protein